MAKAVISLDNEDIEKLKMTVMNKDRTYFLRKLPVEFI